MGKKSKKSAGVAKRDAPPTVLGNPALADWWGAPWGSTAGQRVSDKTAMGVTGFWRCVNLLTVVATVPLKTYENLPDGTRERSTSFLDRPHPLMTPFEWMELYIVHLAVWGNAYHLKGFNGAQAISALQPIHPACVTVDVEEDEQTGFLFKTYTVTFGSEQRVYTDLEILHTPGLSTDGLVGISLLNNFRRATGTAIAGDDAAARNFENGSMISGLVTTEDDVGRDQLEEMADDVRRRIQGTERAGDLAFVNRTLKFTPWGMTNEDAQFLESRQFSIEEFARMYGIPKVLLALDGASTWGSGIKELILGWQKFDLKRLSDRIAQRLSTLLGNAKFVDFDYAGLLEPDQAEVITLLLAELAGGLVTLEEARRAIGLPPIDAPEPTPQEEPVDAGAL